MTEPIEAPVIVAQTTNPIQRWQVLQDRIYTAGRQAGRNVEIKQSPNMDGFSFQMFPSTIDQPTFVTAEEIFDAPELSALATQKLALVGL